MKHCTQVEKLLALYIEGDLDRETETGVTSHLARCSLCKALAEEFSTSQQWLRSYTPPDFDSDSFADSRRAVLQQTARRGRSWVMFARSLAPMPRLALAMLIVAILVGVLVATIALTRTTGSDSRDLQTNYPPSNNSPTPPGGEKFTEKREVIDDAVIHPTKRQRSTNRTMQSVIKFASLVPPVLPPRANTPDFAAEQDSAASLGTFEVDLADTEMLRIEIETGDPQIRIIWFTPKALDGLEKPATETRTESIQETL